MNAAIEKMLTRHAIRRFRPEQISEAELQQVLEAGLYAPSAGNNQESRLVVCQNAELNEKLGRINRFMQLRGRIPPPWPTPFPPNSPASRTIFPS